jgi:hypothetical protein
MPIVPSRLLEDLAAAVAPAEIIERILAESDASAA